MRYAVLTVLFVACILNIAALLPAKAKRGLASAPVNEVLNWPSDVARDIDDLEKSTNPDGVKSIADRIERGIKEKQLSVEVGTTPSRNERRLVLEMWVKAIDTVNRKIDPAFDPEDAPLMNVPVPSVPPTGPGDPKAPPGGHVSGMSPDDIKDPKVRERYEQAMKENSEKASRHRLQRTLHQLDREWSSKAGAFMRKAYSSRSEDVREIDGVLNSLVRDEAKRIELRREFLGIP